MAADRAEIEQLIRKADAAGDADSVRVLFGELDKLGQSPQAPIQQPPVMGGMGGFNPMMGRLSGATQQGMSELGMTPENVASPMKNALGPLESVAQAGTGGLGMIAGGLAGIGQGAWNSLVPESMQGPQAGDRVRQVQDAITYQPRTGMGAGMSRVAGLPGEVVSKGTDYLGEKTADATGSPALGAAVKTTGEVFPAVVGARSIPKAKPKLKGTYTPKPEAPTTAELGAAAKEAYRRADESGIAMTPESFEKMRGDLLADLQKEGIDPTLHPKATAAMKRIADETGPMTLQKAETLRRIASDAMDTLEKSDARRAGNIVDAIDDYIENIKDSDLVSGEAKDASAFAEARGLYSRKRKAEEIERLMDRAKLSATGYENGLRIEFRSLAKNDRKFRRFNKEEQAAIRRVAEGGTAENALRLVGKLAPTGIVSGGLSSGAGLVALGPVGAVGIPAAGFAARLGAEALTKRNAEKAAILMRRGKLNATPLTTERTTPQTGGPQAGAASAAVPQKAKARSVAAIQADIQRLSERARFELANEEAGSPKVQALSAELTRLQNELQARLVDR
jgi:hypothetical protein